MKEKRKRKFITKSLIFVLFLIWMAAKKSGFLTREFLCVSPHWFSFNFARPLKRIVHCTFICSSWVYLEAYYQWYHDFCWNSSRLNAQMSLFISVFDFPPNESTWIYRMIEMRNMDNKLIVSRSLSVTYSRISNSTAKENMSKKKKDQWSFLIWSLLWQHVNKMIHPRNKHFTLNLGNYTVIVQMPKAKQRCLWLESCLSSQPIDITHTHTHTLIFCFSLHTKHFKCHLQAYPLSKGLIFTLSNLVIILACKNVKSIQWASNMIAVSWLYTRKIIDLSLKGRLLIHLVFQLSWSNSKSIENLLRCHFSDLL